MDFLGQAQAFGLLGLDDAHLHVRGQLGVGDLPEQAGVATLEEEPGVLHAPNRKLEFRELLLVATKVCCETLDLRPESPVAGVFCAGLGGGGRIDLIHRRERGAVDHFELIAETVPATQRVVVGLAITLGDRAKIVGSVAQRGFRFGV